MCGNIVHGHTCDEYSILVSIWGMIEVVCLASLYLLLQHLRVLQGGRYQTGIFDGVLYHFTCSLVEDNIRHFFSYAVHRIKMFLLAREN
jgi:hypothetical protein